MTALHRLLPKKRKRRRLVDAAFQQLAADRLIARDVIEEAVEEADRAALSSRSEARCLADDGDELRAHCAELRGRGDDLRVVHAVAAEAALADAGQVKLVRRRCVGCADVARI